MFKKVMLLGIAFYILFNFWDNNNQNRDEDVKSERDLSDIDIATGCQPKNIKDSALSKWEESVLYRERGVRQAKEDRRAEEMQRLAEQKIEEDRVKKKQRLAKVKAKERKKKDTQVASRGNKRNAREFTATAYDLTVASCGKSQSHPAYGVTANGTSLKGQTLQSARAIAVDPKVIKLGSKVHVEFLDSEYKHLTGVFNAVDTGGAIKGNRVDIFFGDTGDSQTSDEVWKFGKRKVIISVLD